MAAAKVEGLLNTTTDPDTMETILEKYKNDLSPEMYDYFKFYIGVIKKELDKQKEGVFTEKEDKNKKTPTATTPSGSPKDIWTNKKEMEKINKEFHRIKAAAKVEALLNTTTDPDTMETILEKYKNDLSPEMYDYFKFIISVIKKESD